jgi:signal transduction histidine kinase/ActR/RegA family two-component response regulator
MIPLVSLPVQKEVDIVLARQRAREVAERLGFDAPAQARLAAAVSEIARNALQHAGRGRVEFGLERDAEPACLWVEVSDSGPGLPPDYAQMAGMGMASARRLVDRFEVESVPGQSTVVHLAMRLPTLRAPTEREAQQLAGDLNSRGPTRGADPEALPLELLRLSHELARALAEAEQLRQEVNELNTELENTNRGVVALYAELDEKAEQLKRADELKTRFFSNMSHEFRTPVNSILALSRLLLDRVDGDLSDEQVKQVTFIRQAAQELGELVNDLLDLVKVDAGRVVVRPAPFEPATLYATLRAMFRPLATNPAVAFVVDEPAGIPAMYTDESKLSQILRNFISNALKFTERGEVRVSGRLAPGGDAAIFAVADTGIGIAVDDQKRIFQEFSQLENPIQKRVKGTGLGLALSKRLAELLGGRIGLQSEVGIGSTFYVEIPLRYDSRLPAETRAAPVADAAGAQEKILIVDDDPIARYLLKGLLAQRSCIVLEAPDGAAGLRLAREAQPDAIFLDLIMPGLTGAQVLERLRAEPATQHIPVIVITSQVLDELERERLAAGVVTILSKEALGTDNTAQARQTIAAALEQARRESQDAGHG